MATYKIIQDIEAEDKIIGPLTLRQLIYAFVTAAVVGIGFFIGGRLNLYLGILVGLVGLPFAFLAFPWRRDQPNDIWLLARLNFLLCPKKRLWQQLGSTFQPVIINSSAEAGDQPADLLKNQQTPDEIEARVRDLSELLDSDTNRPVAVNQATAVNDEHDHRHHHLNQHFKNLLTHHHARRHQRASHSVAQKLKTRPRNWEPQNSSVVHLEQNQVVGENGLSGASQTAIMEQLEAGGDLKMSTLASLVNKLKLAKKTQQPDNR